MIIDFLINLEGTDKMSIYPEIKFLDNNTLSQIAIISKKVHDSYSEIKTIQIKIQEDHKEELTLENTSAFFENLNKLGLVDSLEIEFDFYEDLEEKEKLVLLKIQNKRIRKTSDEDFLNLIEQNRLIRSEPEFFYDPRSYVELLNKLSFLISKEGFLSQVDSERIGENIIVYFSIGKRNHKIEFKQIDKELNREVIIRLDELLKRVHEVNKEIIEVFPAKKENTDYWLFFSYLDLEVIKKLKQTTHA